MERPRFGYRRLHVMLRRKGWRVNSKLVLRLVRENGWLVRRKQRKKLAAVPRVPTPQPTRANEAWAMDFVFDGTAGGRTFRTLNLIDRLTRERLVIEVDTSITGQRVVAVLALLVAMRGRRLAKSCRTSPECLRSSRPLRASGMLFAMGSWSVYLLRCGDGTLYAGATTDLAARLEAHRRGRGARYTRGRGPLCLLWSEGALDRSAALRRERAIKALSRSEKLLLCGTASRKRKRAVGVP